MKKNLFSINEEMGFTREEIKTMVLRCPDILKTFNELQLCEQFEVLHNEAGINHETLLAKNTNNEDNVHLSKRCNEFSF